MSILLELVVTHGCGCTFSGKTCYNDSNLKVDKHTLIEQSNDLLVQSGYNHPLFESSFNLLHKSVTLLLQRCVHNCLNLEIISKQCV